MVEMRHGWAYRSASATEAEQLVVRRGNPFPLFEQDLRGHPGKGHPIAAVAERECMTWITPMRADVGQAVGRDREQAFPRVVDAEVGERRRMRLIVGAPGSRGIAQTGPEHRRW